MKLNLPGLVLIFTGALFIYAAFERKDPRNVLLEAIGSKRRVGDPPTQNIPVPAPGVTPAPAAPPISTTDGGPWVSV
jgi:hypothetical protein